MKYVYAAVFNPEEDGFTVYFPDLPGCHTCGDTIEQAVDMANDVLATWMCHLEEERAPIPSATYPGEIKVSGKDFVMAISANTEEYSRFCDNISGGNGTKMYYWLKGLLLVFVVLPAMSIGLFRFLFLDVIWEYSHDDTGAAILFFFISCFTGFYFGRCFTRKNDLPANFAPRYWPLLAPMALILIRKIYVNVLSGQYPHDNEFFLYLALCYIPFVFFFACFTPPEKKLTCIKWRGVTCVFIVGLFFVLAWQALQIKTASNNILGYDVYVGDDNDRLILVMGTGQQAC